jgi:hypothetical protein
MKTRIAPACATRIEAASSCAEVRSALETKGCAK